MPNRILLEALLLYAASGLFGFVRAARSAFDIRLSCRKRALVIRADQRDLDEATTEVERLLASPTEAPSLLAAFRTFLSDEERQLVSALGDQELPGSAIARRAGLEHTTRTKLLLANLTSRGVLAPGRNGYKVASPEIMDVIKRATEGVTPG